MYNNRKKLFILLIIAALIFSLFTLYISSEAPFSISAKAAALYIPELEKFIYTKNPDEKLGMASTTKIMTALVALEALDENEILLADKESCGIDGSSLYLRPFLLLPPGYRGKRMPRPQAPPASCRHGWCPCSTQQRCRGRRYR